MNAAVIKLKFLKKLFGMKEKGNEIQERPEKITLSLDDLPEWVKSEPSESFSELKPYIKQKYTEIEASLDNLRKDKEKLENAEIKNQGVPRAVQSNKENFVKNLNIILDKIAIPQDTDPLAAYQFCLDAMSTLNTCVDNSIRSQQYIKPILPEIFKNLSSDLSGINTSLSELRDRISKVKDKLDVYKNLPDKIEEANQLHQEIEDKNKSIRDLEDKYESTNINLSDAKSRLETLKESENYLKAGELEGEIQNLNAEISNIDSELKDLFAPLSKAMFRMEKQDKSGRHTLSSETREIVEKINNNEVHLLAENRVVSFLTDTKKRVEDGSLGLKQRKMNNTLEQINYLLESDAFSSLVGRRKSYLSQLEELEGKLNELTVYKEKSQLEKQISGYQSTLESTQNELDSERKHLEELEQRKDNLIGKLQSELNYVFDKDIEIKS
ncbi:MAG: hypothetical protein ACLFMM_03265 [Methanohalobium sp.]|uniref:hypothetical protein n=1 Tax=Methanohalobium sp. TaxID=2837493 RepID=UPI0039783837